MSRILLTSALMLSVAASAAMAQKAPPKNRWLQSPGESRGSPACPQPDRASLPTRLVYRVKHVPAADLAETVNNFLEAEMLRLKRRAAGVVIVPDVITNSLIVSAPSDEIEQLGELIEALDRQPAMVSIEVLIAEVGLDEGDDEAARALLKKATDEGIDAVVADLKSHGQIRVLARPLITALDNQSAFINIGRRRPRITGTTISARGRTYNVTLENVGLTLGVTARISDDGLVTMEIDLEQSNLGPADEGAPISSSRDGKETRSPEIGTTTLQTTVSAKSGQTVVLGGLISRQEAEGRGMLILLAPHIVSLK